MNSLWDAVVIGGGVNGLVAATCLTRAGVRALVLERGPALGGLAGSVEFAPGFHGDPVGLDGGWMPPEVRRAVGLPAGDLEYDWSGEVVAPGPAGGWLRLHPDPSGAATELRRFSTRDAERWPEFCALLTRLAGFLQTVYAAPAPRIDATTPVELTRLLGFAQRLRGLGRREMIDLLRVIPMPVQELLDDWFESDLLKGVVGTGGVTHLCQGPRSGGTAFMLLNRQVGRPVGALRARALIRGGVDRLGRLLGEAAQRAGVKVRTGAEVAQVTVEDDRVTGVLLSSGEAIAARRVVSSADPYRTLLGFLDPVHLDPDLIHAVRQVKFRGVTARVYLAVDGLPGLLPGEPALRGVLSVSPSLDYLERAYDAAKYGRVSERPFLEVTFPSVTDPCLAPAGKHVVSIHLQYAPHHLRDGVWDSARREALGDRAVALLEEVLPGLEARILHRAVLTPRDLEERYGLTEGAVTHGELTLDQTFFMRPIPGWARYRMPVEGLYLCGAGAHPGPAVAGGPGYLASRAVLRELNRR